jgi:hypothetical protein
MSIAVKTDTGWQVLGAGESSGGGATKWGDWTIVDAPDEADTWTAPDSQGRIWKYVEFNTPGTYDINLTGGMYWVLCVGGGAWSYGATLYTDQGQPGLVNEGYWEFGSGPQIVTVGKKGDKGAGAADADNGGQPSSVGDYGTQGFVTWGQRHTGRGSKSYADNLGYKSFITGTGLEYATGAGGLDRPGRSGDHGDTNVRDGCVIIATVDEDKTDYYPPGALPGVGGWATITGIDGTAGTRYQYGDWVAYEWTADGELTTTNGLIEYALAGSGAANIDNKWGQPGDFITGIVSVTAKPHAITIGIGGAPGSNIDNTPRAQPNTSLENVAYARGHQSVINYYDPATFQAYTTSLTGTERELCGYPYTGQTDHPGMGGRSGGVYNPVAQDGICIVRVPKAHAYLGALPAGWVDA